MFSRYADGEAGNYGFNSFFVSKAFVDSHNGVGSIFTLNSSALFGVMGAKYLYLHDDHIKRPCRQQQIRDKLFRVTYNNAGFVLRYVIGV